MFGTMVISASFENQTVDEAVHLSAGVSYWTSRDFRMNIEHPPLSKLFAGLPLLILRPNIPFDHPSWASSDEWTFGHEFLYANIISPDILLFFGRLPTQIIGLLAALFVFIIATAVVGPKAGLGPFLLFAFDPAIVAHSRYITNDAWIMFGYEIAIFSFVLWLSKKSLPMFFMVIGSLAFAFGSKFSAFFLIPIMGLIWIAHVLFIKHQPGFSLQKEMKDILALVGVAVPVVFFLIWAMVFFTLQPLDGPNRIISPPIPLGEYFNGISFVFGHNTEGHLAYFLSEVSEKGGWPLYFPVAFLLKTPLPTVLLLFIAFLWVVKTIFRQGFLKKSHPMLVASWIVIFGYGLFSILSNISIGIRHLLPIYPFLMIVISPIFQIRFQKFWQRRLYHAVIWSMVGLSVLSSFLIFPHYLSFFNILAGGPRGGPRYLLDSNIDWGQDLKNLKRFMDRKGIDKIALQYFGKTPASSLEINALPLPTTEDIQHGSPIPAHAGISVQYLYMFPKEYSWLFEREPNARIGYSIYYYRF